MNTKKKGLERSGQAMLIAVRFPGVLVSALLLSVVQPVSNAQDGEPFKFFRNYVGLHEDQITAIRNGKAVAKIVESSTPDEVFVFGSIYVQSTPEKYLKLASDPEELRKLPNYLALRKFSDPPQLSDFEGFTLEADDIKQLKNCEPGRCDVQLPSEAMDAFKQSVNWSAPDTPNQVNRLGQKMALEALERYIQGGMQSSEYTGTNIIRQKWRRRFSPCSAARRRFLFIYRNWIAICSIIRKQGQKTSSPSFTGKR
jgi:hypothetical protein